MEGPARDVAQRGQGEAAAAAGEEQEPEQQGGPAHLPIPRVAQLARAVAPSMRPADPVST